MNKVRTGGCQCGAVRFRADSLRNDSHVCHCRMCQKAVGNFFAALVGVPHADFSWTRGEPAEFRSSEHVDRGFCATCGTPLFYRHNKADHISLTTGSFDHPEDIPLQTPVRQRGATPADRSACGIIQRGYYGGRQPGARCEYARDVQATSGR